MPETSTDSASVTRSTSAEPLASGPTPPLPAGRGWLLAALLGATVLGTISNNIVNVPLRQIIADFDAPVTQGVLVAAASVLVLAVAMPLTGWISDRLGRRRTLVLALSMLSVGTLGATVAPTLTLLVLSRGLQGLGCAAVPVAVMGTLARTFPPERRNSVMGAWGAANGIGQAVGPPVGGLVADAFGWRAIFGALVPLTVGVLILTLRVVPRDAGQHTRIDGVGAGTLTVGVALLMTAATAAPQPGVPGWIPIAGAVLGLASLVAFVVSGLRRRNPFIDPRLLVEIRWLRSATGVFVQQSSLAAVLVAVPLYLTGVVGLSVSVTGLLVFCLPLVWAVAAPLVGLLADRVGPRPVLRTGLALLAARRRRPRRRPGHGCAAPGAGDRADARRRHRDRPRADARAHRRHPLPRRPARRRPRAVQHDAVRGRGHRHGRRGRRLARRPGCGCSAAAPRWPSAVWC